MADRREKALVDMCNSLADQLKAMERGDPGHIPVAARLIVARKKLAAYREKKKT